MSETGGQGLAEAIEALAEKWDHDWQHPTWRMRIARRLLGATPAADRLRPILAAHAPPAPADLPPERTYPGSPEYNFGWNDCRARMLAWLADREGPAGGDAALRARVEAVLTDSCHHCGRMPEADGDHTCLCPMPNSECLLHTVDPVVGLLPIRAALAAEGGTEGDPI